MPARRCGRFHSTMPSAHGWDCALVVTDHTAFDYSRIAALPLVVDTRNALKGFAGKGLFAL